MKNNSENARREKFKAFLYDLAEDQNYLQDEPRRFETYKRLESIYEKLPDDREFRHYYSDIFFVLTDVFKNPEKGSIDIIGQNLKIIKDGYDNKKAKIDVSEKINKLFDHVNLEMARILFSESRYRDVSNETAVQEMNSRVSEIEEKIDQAEAKINQAGEQINQAEAKINQAGEQVNQAEAKIEKTTIAIDKQQREYISILGIFASIVLSFTAGISFSSSTFGSINDASIYRLVLVACTLGVIIISILYGLFYYIDRLAIRETKKTLRPLIVSYIVLVAMMVIVVIAWQFGWVEKRNSTITENTGKNTIISEQTIEEASNEGGSIQ